MNKDGWTAISNQADKIQWQDGKNYEMNKKLEKCVILAKGDVY